MPDTAPASLGEFCWIELATDDFPAAQRFYREVLGWTLSDFEGEGHMRYSHVQGAGRELGGAYELLAEQKQHGIPPHWMSYVRVAQVEDAMARCEELGGRVHFGPCDVPGAGRLAVLMDPSGATFSVWQDGERRGAGYAATPGEPCWFELMSRDADAARPFYEGLFGWQSQEMDMGPAGTYVVFRDGERQAAGMVAMPAEAGEAPSCWMVYVAVDDCDAAVGRVTAARGQVYVPPTDIPGIGRFAVVADPTGASLALIRLAEASA